MEFSHQTQSVNAISFPSSQFASAMKIVRPLESTAETQPQHRDSALAIQLARRNADEGKVKRMAFGEIE
jgi:hypothetical protein